jgi:Fe-S-cluster-containing dehydrogenase component
MDTESCFLIVRCIECTQKVCAVICKNAALAFMHGDLLIDTQKCLGCNMSGFKQGLPECVADCTYASQKAIITETSIDDKRTQAVNALSLIL